MKARCPKNPAHTRFITVVHVTQDWVVDEEGNFVEVFGDEAEVAHGPNPSNTWTCIDCDAEAEVTD